MKKLSKIYTYGGDQGFTRNLTGDVMSKDDCLIELHGDIDSLQAIIDKLVAYSRYSSMVDTQKELLVNVQVLLWQLGGEISQKGVGGFVKKPISEQDILELEKVIDDFELSLNGFQRFTHLISIDINEARVRTRKLERTLTDYLRRQEIRPEVYKYINRLSDYFFGLAVKVQQNEKDL